MKFVPMNGRVLVIPPAPEEVSKGGIIIPDSAQEEEMIGQVDCVCAESDLTPGDFVVYGKYAGSEVAFDGKKYRVIPEEELFGKFVE